MSERPDAPVPTPSDSRPPSPVAAKRSSGPTASTVAADLEDRRVDVLHDDLSTRTVDGRWELSVPATFVIRRGWDPSGGPGLGRRRHRMEPAEIEDAGPPSMEARCGDGATVLSLT
jgi:hypothetical protein